MTVNWRSNDLRPVGTGARADPRPQTAEDRAYIKQIAARWWPEFRTRSVAGGMAPRKFDPNDHGFRFPIHATPEGKDFQRILVHIRARIAGGASIASLAKAMGVSEAAIESFLKDAGDRP